jgi:rubrerythrin
MMAEDKKKFGSVNEVLDFAIAREVEAYDFYMKLAALAQRPQTVKVIKDLAVEERQHKIRLEAVKAGEIVIEEEEIGDLGIAGYIEDVKPTAGMSYTELLVLAMKKENKSYRLYTDLAAVAHTKELRDIFSRLAQEEAEHKLRFEFEYDLTTFQARTSKK